MPVVEIASFAAFANLVVAGCRLAAVGTTVDAVKALADVATGAKSLDVALGTIGLAAVATEMARTAEEHALHFTHPGPARDDAIKLFWQVAPAAFADPAVFAAAHLDPALTAERMVAAIRAGPLGRDFREAVLAEPFFRGVAETTLAVMLARADTVAALAPALWRQALATAAATKDDTAEILALVRDLHAIKATTVPEATLIAMARKISPRVADRDEALRALDAAAGLAAEAQARGEAGSNVDAFVDATLRRLAALTAVGRLDAAAAAADEAVDAAEAGLAQLLDAAIRQNLLAFDAEGAARQIVRRLTLDAGDPGRLFDALRSEQATWYERGRDQGLRLDLEVAIELARPSVRWARDANERGMALNNLGNALWTLGARESGTARLEEAVAAYQAALDDGTRHRAPLDWAKMQSNLGAALQTLGARESGTARLEEAVAAYHAALEEMTPESVPLDWAAAQNNLGSALQTLGARESGTARLEEAVVAHRASLGDWTRERVPLDWAAAQNNLGNALRTLGERESGTARLEEAVAAYRAALEERTRERVPLDWATTQSNLGNALWSVGLRESGTARLEEAVAAYCASLGERTRDRVPLDWAATQTNLGNALRTLGERQSGTARLEEAVAAYRAALEERPRERVPLDWANTQNNLGTALETLGQREGGTARLEDAISAYRAALEERTRERVPLGWAITTGNQGIALCALAELTADVAMAREAREQIVAAEAAMREGGHTHGADHYAGEISAADALVARLSNFNEDESK